MKLTPLTKVTEASFELGKKIKENAAIDGPSMGELEFKFATKKQLIKEFKTLWRLG